MRIRTRLSNDELIGGHRFFVNFSDTCKDASFTPTINDIVWTPTSHTYDLLTESSKKIDNDCPNAVAAMTYSPANCGYELRCKIMRKSDDVDMETLMSTVYRIGKANALNLTPDGTIA